MSAFYSTRVAHLSRLPATVQIWTVARHQTRVHQIGHNDKCASGTSSTVTYLCFSRNFPRLGVPLKKWPLSPYRHTSEARSLCTSLSWGRCEDCLTESVNCWHPTIATTTASPSDCNHRSSTPLADHLGAHLSASKLTGNFASATASNSSIHWARIGAIKGATRTTRDTRNNKWTSVGQPTRPQHEEQVPRPLAVSSSEAALESLAASPLALRAAARSNAPNKLMTSSALGPLQRRLMQHTGAPANPLLSIATSRSPVSGEVICKQQRASLSTSSARLDSEHGPVKRCWRCDKPINAAAPSPAEPKAEVPVCVKCGSIQPISGDVNFFGLFNLDPCFDIDLAHLRQHYLRLQQNMHPDMNVNRSNTETGYSLDNSSIINSAYKTLRDPYQRALYLLKVRYNMSIDEGNIQTEPELLLEIMELNEDIELADDKESLMEVSSRLEHDIEAIVAGLKKAFAEDNANDARALVVRYAYYNSSLLKVKDQLANRP